LSSLRTVCLQTLTRGPVSLATMVSEHALPLLVVGSGGRAAVIFLFWLLTLTCGPVSWVTMVSEPTSTLLVVRSERVGISYLFILAVDANAWARNFFRMKRVSLKY
jgi:hypothetical protein